MSGEYELGMPANAPESVKARLMAARLLAQSASAASAPYSSKGVAMLKGIEGLMGGLQERSAIQEAQQGQAQQRAQMAQLLLGSASPGAMAAGVAAAPVSAPTSSPISQGGIGSDRVASPGDGSTRDLAIRTIAGEAGGESDIGKAGVAAVLKNRLASGQFGPDMRSVILAPKQFSLWNPGDPAGDTARRLDPSSPAYQKIGAIYDGVMSGQTPDPTGGATHYYNPRAASPAWGPQLAAQNDVTIGNHRFVGMGPAGPNGGVQVASATPGTIGDAAVLAARNRLASGTGTDADRATVSTYLQQQNTPAATRTASADVPAPNAQPVSAQGLPPGVTPAMFGGSAPEGQPSPYGAMPTSMAQSPAQPDSATLAAALRGQAGGSGPGATPLPASVQPSSPFGSLPASMDQAPAAPPAGPMMASAPPPSPPSPPSSPFGAPPQAMTPQGGVDPAMLAGLAAQGAAASQSSPFGAGPQPMQGTSGVDPAIVAALLKRGAPTTAVGSPAPDPSIMQASAPSAPQTPPLSPNALAMGDLGPGGPGPSALDPSAGALPAAGLSTGQLPGMDNFAGAGPGSVRQTSIVDPSDPASTPGFTGSFGPGLQPQISGQLPPPSMLAQGSADMPAPASPSPAIMAAALRQGAPSPQPGPTSPLPAAQPPVPPAAAPAAPIGQQTASLMPGAVDDFGRTPDQAMAGAPPSLPDVTTAAMAKAGYDTTGLPGATPTPTPPLPMMAGANVPPPDLSGLAGSPTPPPGSGLPIMQRASSNPPAEVAALAAGLSGTPAATTYTSTEPSSRPGAQAMRQPKPGDADGLPLPTPRPSNAALGLNPDAPAPNAVQAGPAPVSPQVMGSLLRQQPMGLPGNSPTSDPSSAVNFNLQQAQRAQGGQGYANPTARALAGQTAPAPQAAQQQDDGNPLSAIGRLFGQGGNGQGGGLGGMMGNLPIIGGMLGGQSQGGNPLSGLMPGSGPNGQAAGSSANGGQGQGQAFQPGGQGQPAAMQGGGQGSQAQVPGLGMSQQQAIALLSNPYTTPQQAELIMNRLAPQPMKLSQGEGLVGRRPDGTYGNLYTQAPTADWSYDHDAGTITNKATGEQRQVGAAPVTMSPGQVRIGANGAVQAAVPATPDYKPVPGTGAAMNSRDGSLIGMGAGAGASIHAMKVNGVDVPMMVTPDPNGGPPQVRLLTPGAASGQPGAAGGPISFNGTAQTGGASPAAAGPLDGIAPLMKQAGQMEAQNAAAKEGAVGQVKGATTYVEAAAKNGNEAANHVAELQQLKGLSAAAPSGFSADMARYAADHGLVTATGDAVKSYDGMRAYLGTQLRQAGSGALRNQEMDKLSDVLGSTNASPAARSAAIQRIQDGYARQAAFGQVASDPAYADPMAKQARIQDLQQTWMNADAAIEAHPDKRPLIISRMQAAGVPVVGF